MSVHIPAALRRAVLERSAGRCEDCRVSERFDIEPLQLDHVRPLRHGGRTVAGNLAPACWHCNQWKGPSIAAFDPLDDRPAFLFNPRGHIWEEHFEVRAGVVLGRTPAGRATAGLLKMNEPARVRLRARGVPVPPPA